MNKKIPFTLAILAISLLTIIAAQMLRPSTPEKDLRATHLKGGDFSLTDGQKNYSLSTFKGKPLLLYFGYTFCPDVCPVGLAVIRDALNHHETLSDVPAVFVTLDPKRDHAERLKEYVGFFHPNIVALTGDPAEIKRFSAAYGTFSRSLSESESDTNYTVDHSAYYYIIDGQGELIRVLDHDARSQEIAELLLSLK